MPQLKDKILIHKISKEIKRIRMEKGITQEVFYFDSNIHIGRIEQGKNNITISTLKEICGYLDIKMSELLSNIKE